jgi:light-regulated signal transduction histidine kinase (bacteriophytochrome)
MEIYRKINVYWPGTKIKTINQNLEQEIRDRKLSEKKVLELNKELVENVAKLESANKALDQFAFMASHDLQEPLRKSHFF